MTRSTRTCDLTPAIPTAEASLRLRNGDLSAAGPVLGYLAGGTLRNAVGFLIAGASPGKAIMGGLFTEALLRTFVMASVNHSCNQLEAGKGPKTEDGVTPMVLSSKIVVDYVKGRKGPEWLLYGTFARMGLMLPVYLAFGMPFWRSVLGSFAVATLIEVGVTDHVRTRMAEGRRKSRKKSKPGSRRKTTQKAATKAA